MACINTCGSLGSLARLAVEDSILTGECPPATFDADSTRFEFLSETIQYTDVILGSDGLTGTIDKIANHLRSGTRVVFGRLMMEVGPHEIDFWMPRILGKTGNNSSPYTTAETFDLKPFDIMLDRDGGTVIYRHCAVNWALFRSRASIDGNEQVMQMTLDIIGYEEHDSEWPTPGPALPTGDRLYWLLGDGKLTLDTETLSGSSSGASSGDFDEYYFDSFNLLINNNLRPLTRNFLNITCLQSGGRDIRLQVSTPYDATSHEYLYIDRFDGSGVLNFLGTKNLEGEVGEDYITTFTFPRLYQTRRTPSVSGPGDIPLSLDLESYRTGAEEPITVTVQTEALV